MCDLTGRVAIISGAASGIGAATARTFARAGADVVLGWFPGDPHDVEQVRDSVAAAGRQVVVHELDVSSTASVDAFARSAIDSFGRIDVVVANAGIARTVPSLELTDQAWNQVVEVNLLGVWRCFRAALPYMQEAGYGRLLATSSVAGTVQCWTEHAHYTAAKAGIVGLVRSLAIEFGKHGITVNVVAPGVIESPQSLDPINSLGAEGVAAAGRGSPVGRVGRPEDIASLYLYLASEAASFMNGQLLVMDGGRSLVVSD
ncbi:MAG: SDR family oxidoreductase [Candidatus Dormibacteraeota bacterium]|uniref:SDR family oxidoreductase n=1 Tax=Candidatus Dormiibacter inghamiae TaxID=3127013 RepID=A0A934KGU2_9BACT|nr:SDR family oxidoreductase [Candidatus Dormibacteraeota bacterium]MBJ7606504.1 SDR family oxidoreductase [Candidatus Dormibacteraeota bacterium]